MEKYVVFVVLYVVVIALMLYCFFISKGSDRGWVTFVQKHLYILLIILAANTVSFGLSMKKKEADYYIRRQDVDGQDKEYTFKIATDEDVGGFTLKVPPKKLKPKEAEEKLGQAFNFLDENIKGDNASMEHVTKDINISLDYSEYPFDVEVRSSDYSLVDEDGVLRNDTEQLKALGYSEGDMLSGIPVTLNVKLCYGELERDKDYSFTVFPREKSDFQQMVDKIQKMYERKEQESLYEEGFKLPAEYEGVSIIFPEGEGINPGMILLFGIIIAGLLLFREAENRKNAEVKQRQQLLQAYPWFINEMVLLMGAGMQIRNIFSLLINDYEREDREKGDDYRLPLINELKHARHDFEIGMGEGRVYYELGRRLKLPCYIKVLTLLEQNVTKGSKGIAAILEQEEKNALEERMNLVRKAGEEAGTKLLGPMVLLLIIVMLMIMVPAFLSFA